MGVGLLPGSTARRLASKGWERGFSVRSIVRGLCAEVRGGAVSVFEEGSS